eukprot:CAMPEP_0175429572 /NCGR_PEP_ID=MMETSP0095-20121207/51424_1 /TAXON_ID=311494 /ORGANISM="Alexandrium monilatum, Strain CCMP3105" /LENGTH=385 /DNA_ID=CAMNT_0016729019 /DNA_START=53 /DNA_END=1208 /DNA_ORIENTATION=-
MASPPASGSPRLEDYRDRTARLSDKLLVLHEGLDQDRNTRFEYLQGKVKQLDERVSVSQDATTRKFSVLKDQLGAFQAELGREGLSRERMAREAREELARVDAALQAGLASEQEARRESEARILHGFEAKTTALKDELGKSGRLRLESESSLRRYLEVDIPRLYESLKEEVENREAMEQSMLRRAMEEVTQVQGAILEEKRAREEAEEAMLRMMEDVVAKVQAEIASERRERERTEEMLTHLLHETCQKLHTASQVYDSVLGPLAVLPNVLQQGTLWHHSRRPRRFARVSIRSAIAILCYPRPLSTGRIWHVCVSPAGPLPGGRAGGGLGLQGNARKESQRFCLDCGRRKRPTAAAARHRTRQELRGASALSDIRAAGRASGPMR